MYLYLFIRISIVPGDEKSAETTYLCGNSLGLQPKNLQSYLNKELTAWKDLGVEGSAHSLSILILQ